MAVPLNQGIRPGANFGSMANARIRQALKLDWTSAWERKRFCWVFYIRYADVKRMRELLEVLAPFGYRAWGEIKRLRPGQSRSAAVELFGQFSEKQVHAEIMRVHRACDRLDLDGLDDVDVEEIDVRRRYIN